MERTALSPSADPALALGSSDDAEHAPGALHMFGCSDQAEARQHRPIGDAVQEPARFFLADEDDVLHGGINA